MNSKMTTNSQLTTMEPKNKNELSKQLERSRITEMEITGRVISGGVRGGGGEGTGDKKHKWKVENRQGEVKNSIGNV